MPAETMRSGSCACKLGLGQRGTEHLSLISHPFFPSPCLALAPSFLQLLEKTRKSKTPFPSSNQNKHTQG